MHRLCLVGKLESRDCFEDKAFPGRLISKNDELKEVDLSANAMTVEVADDVKDLFHDLWIGETLEVRRRYLTWPWREATEKSFCSNDRTVRSKNEKVSFRLGSPGPHPKLLFRCRKAWAILSAFSIITLQTNDISATSPLGGDKDLTYHPSQAWIKSVEALVKVFQLLYWNRAWIVEEMSLPGKPRFTTALTSCHSTCLSRPSNAILLAMSSVSRMGQGVAP